MKALVLIWLTTLSVLPSFALELIDSLVVVDTIARDTIAWRVGAG